MERNTGLKQIRTPNRLHYYYSACISPKHVLKSLPENLLISIKLICTEVNFLIINPGDNVPGIQVSIHRNALFSTYVIKRIRSTGRAQISIISLYITPLKAYIIEGIPVLIARLLPLGSYRSSLPIFFATPTYHTSLTQLNTVPVVCQEAKNSLFRRAARKR